MLECFELTLVSNSRLNYWSAVSSALQPQQETWAHPCIAPSQGGVCWPLCIDHRVTESPWFHALTERAKEVRVASKLVPIFVNITFDLKEHLPAESRNRQCEILMLILILVTGDSILPEYIKSKSLPVSPVTASVYSLYTVYCIRYTV